MTPCIDERSGRAPFTSTEFGSQYHPYQWESAPYRATGTTAHVASSTDGVHLCCQANAAATIATTNSDSNRSSGSSVAKRHNVRTFAAGSGCSGRARHDAASATNARFTRLWRMCSWPTNTSAGSGAANVIPVSAMNRYAFENGVLDRVKHLKMSHSREIPSATLRTSGIDS